MPLTLPPIQIHVRIAAEPAEIRPWSIDPLGIRAISSNRGKGVRVGVIDTGIDRMHAESGWLRSSFRAGKDFTGSRNGFWDGHGHGTHVNGTICGDERVNGGPSLAPLAALYVGRGLGDDGSGGDDSIADAARYLRFTERCHLINLSLGGPMKSPAILKALYEVIDDGGIVVCAAGNEGDFSTSWPANDDRMISVAATDKQSRPADFSSPSSVDVAAPGVQILSCYANGSFAVLSGTSMAAPWFTGWLAIYFSDLLAAGLPLPNQLQLFDKIDEWTRDIGTPGKDRKTGAGLVSPEKYRKMEPPAKEAGLNVFGLCRLYRPSRLGDWFSVGAA